MDRRVVVLAVAVTLALLVVNPLFLPLHGGQSDDAPGAVGDPARPAHGVASDRGPLPGGLSVASIFPIRSDREPSEDRGPEVVGLTDDRAGELFDALSAGTARELLHHLTREPLTATELTGRVDTSLQNVHYHLENLREAGAIEVIDTEYSERGREMSVYAAAARPLVIVSDTASTE